MSGEEDRLWDAVSETLSEIDGDLQAGFGAIASFRAESEFRAIKLALLDAVRKALTNPQRLS